LYIILYNNENKLEHLQWHGGISQIRVEQKQKQDIKEYLTAHNALNEK
jgi:hypothetical protein